MNGSIPGHLKKPCPDCHGTGVKLNGIGLCDRCSGSCMVVMELADLPKEQLKPIAPQR